MFNLEKQNIYSIKPLSASRMDSEVIAYPGLVSHSYWPSCPQWRTSTRSLVLRGRSLLSQLKDVIVDRIQPKRTSMRYDVGDKTGEILGQVLLGASKFLL